MDPKKNLGVLLIEFLELYGKYFNYDDVGIAVDAKGAWYFKKVIELVQLLKLLSLLFAEQYEHGAKAVTLDTNGSSG